MSDAPERIYGWLNSQLSIARLWGCCTYNGSEYVIAYGEEGQPLVRADVLKREAKGKRGAKAVEISERGPVPPDPLS